MRSFISEKKNYLTVNANYFYFSSKILFLFKDKKEMKNSLINFKVF